MVVVVDGWRRESGGLSWGEKGREGVEGSDAFVSAKARRNWSVPATALFVVCPGATFDSATLHPRDASAA